jgi:hypothetical protein
LIGSTGLNEAAGAALNLLLEWDCQQPFLPSAGGASNK